MINKHFNINLYIILMASHTQRVLRTTRILANFQIRPENNNPYNTRNQEKMNKDGIVIL